ncbi:FAD-dependent oxidoreductase [Ktedonobacter sp. SOSP1-85]|uniref:FAD-dependent oxidoreductase n=1 Tax=Ktedonobacter sp. SOSP1-85 TaxID=2778367 RepID=UPI001916C789|nr:FAD-dependent oxidoreductase [Ktedonobacter sp. SOSP1-85]
MTTHTHTQPPVIIVGGGLSGLSAAAYLARAGHAVTLFEKSGNPGCDFMEIMTLALTHIVAVA